MKKLNVKALGTKITFYREKLGLKRKDLAGLTGISEEYIANYENGTGSKLNAQTLFKIAKALGVKMDELLEDSLLSAPSSEKPDRIMELVSHFDEAGLDTYMQLLEDFSKSIE